MYRIFALLFFVITILHSSAKGQVCGFEGGTFFGWRVRNGFVSNDGKNVLFPNTQLGSFDQEHIITTKSDGNDPNITAEAIPTVAPGSNFSARFGNVYKGGRYDVLYKYIDVSPDNTIYQYKFAVVLKDGGTAKHSSYQQKPGFSVKIYDGAPDTVTPSPTVPCSSYDVQLDNAASPYKLKKQGEFEYLNWVTIAIDLKKYVGKLLTLEAIVYGCTDDKNHTGYAYFDGKCIKPEITPRTPCADANGDLILDAPEGFEKYLWNTGETTTSIKVKAIKGTKYSVKLIPFSRLNEDCKLEIDYTINKIENVVALDTFICEGNNYLFRGTSYNTAGKYTKIVNNPTACDSIFTLNLKVLPIPQISKNISLCAGENVKIGNATYSNSGVYVVPIKRVGRCDSILTATISVEKSFTLSVTPDVTLEKGDKTEIKVSVNPSGTYTYDWTPKDFLMCSTCASAYSAPSNSTKYSITVSAGDIRCAKKIETNVKVISGVYVPTAFTPNSDSTNDIFYIIGNKGVRMIKEILIYNRWGELIFRDENFFTGDPSHGWDGTYRGKVLAPDTFTYKIIAEMKNGEINDFSGAFTLLR
jgi:gliding motility-associated-like protein